MMFIAGVTVDTQALEIFTVDNDIGDRLMVFPYDADGNVLTRKTRAGQTIGFAYDTLNRLKTKSPPPPATAVNYGYDLNNRLTGVSDGSAAIPAAVPPSASYRPTPRG